MKNSIVTALCALSLNVVAQPTIELVKQFSANNYSNIAVLNGTLLFQGKSSAEGAELWMSDGSTSGTALLVDLFPGTDNANPRFFKNALGKVLFVAYGPSFVNKLWITDGTAPGTFALCDLDLFSSLSIPRGKEVNGKFYFTNATTTEGAELWATDGTVNGTQVVKDINPGSNPSTPANFERLGDTVYFTADNGLAGIELWKSDGTATGTLMVKDIVPGTGNSEIIEIKAFNDKLYFGAGTDTELWQSDGSTTGTVLLKDIGSNYSSAPGGFKEFNNKLYFNAEGPSVAIELYETDGTAPGTLLTADIFTGTGSGLPANFYPVNNKLYMTAKTLATGTELMVYEPTSNIVSLVKDATPGTGSGVSIVFYPNDGADGSKIANLADNVFYAASESGFSDTQIWSTDGTPNGSVKLVYSAATKPNPEQFNLTVMNNEVYFFSDYLGSNSMSLYKITEQSLNADHTASSSINLNMYPNPSGEILHIDMLQPAGTTLVKITNMEGRTVYNSSTTSAKIKIDTEGFSNGIYLVQINNNGNIANKKLVVNK